MILEGIYPLTYILNVASSEKNSLEAQKIHMLFEAIFKYLMKVLPLAKEKLGADKTILIILWTNLNIWHKFCLRQIIQSAVVSFDLMFILKFDIRLGKFIYFIVHILYWNIVYIKCIIIYTYEMLINVSQFTILLTNYSKYITLRNDIE